MIRCTEAVELIPLHVGDDLPAEEARRIEAHLEQCALCVAEYESFAAARVTLLALRDELPARGSLWAEVARGLEAGGAAPESAADAPAARSWTWLKWSSLAAAALVVTSFLPQFLTADPAQDPGAGGPMIQATTPEELNDFLQRTAGMSVNPADPANGEAAADPGQDAPLTTPAGNRPTRPPRRF